MPKQVLVLGGGGREHTISEMLSLSSNVTRVICYPGNGGTHDIVRNARIACPNFDTPITDINRLYDFAVAEGVNLLVPGPELPLALGIADRFRAGGIPVFGPGAQGAQLEASKAFAKKFMQRHNIPTARFRIFDNPEAAKAYVRKRDCPLVIKASGLAGGKGVVVCDTMEECFAAIDDIMVKKIHGEEAGAEIVIEDRLEGTELSFTIFLSDETVVVLPTSRDYKRRFDNDEGPNTGGMGAVSPCPGMTNLLEREIMEQIVVPTVEGLLADSIDYRGVLYIGIMVTLQGPKVLEYNVRLGDPETQAILPLLDRSMYDLFELFMDVAQGTVQRRPVKWGNGAAVGVNLVSRPYPAKSDGYARVHGVGDVSPAAWIYHGATVRDDTGELYAGSGRNFTIVAQGENFAQARNFAYTQVDKIDYVGKSYRTDIGAGLD